MSSLTETKEDHVENGPRVASPQSPSKRITEYKPKEKKVVVHEPKTTYITPKETKERIQKPKVEKEVPVEFNFKNIPEKKKEAKKPATAAKSEIIPSPQDLIVVYCPPFVLS